MLKKIIVNLSVFILILNIFSPGVIAEDNIKDLHFQNTEINEVFRMIGETAGINLIIDGSVQGNITIHLRDISFSKSLDLITKTQGLSYKWDDNTVVVGPSDRIESMYTEIKTEILHIEYADLEKINKLIKTVYPEIIIDIYETNKQIVIKGKKDDLKEVKKIIGQIDLPEKIEEIQIAQNKESKIKIFHLKSKNLNIFRDNIKMFYPDIKVGKNEVKNELIIYGKEGEINKVETLIEKMDVSSSRKKKMETIEIKHKDPVEIQTSLEKVYNNLLVEINNTDNSMILSGEEVTVNKAKILINKLDQEKPVRKITKIIQIDYVEIEVIEKVLNQLFSEIINYESDKKQRKIIIEGEKKDIIRAEKTISDLDKSLPQVKIEAKIEEVSRSELHEIGISPSELNKINFIKNDDNGEIGVESSLSDFFDMLEEKGKAVTLANPRLMTLNGEKGKLLIGDRVPVQVNKNDEEGERLVEYLETGIILEFQPWITKDNNIELEIIPKINNVGEYRNGLPTINTREINTTIKLKNKETFIIGGLIQDNLIEDIKTIPILSDLPLLGKLFEIEHTDNKQSEIIIVITPEIVN